jgi:hypothetical protein
MYLKMQNYSIFEDFTWKCSQNRIALQLNVGFWRLRFPAFYGACRGFAWALCRNRIRSHNDSRDNPGIQVWRHPAILRHIPSRAGLPPSWVRPTRMRPTNPKSRHGVWAASGHCPFFEYGHISCGGYSCSTIPKIPRLNCP